MYEEKFGSEQNFGSKKNVVPKKDFRSHKYFGPQKNFGSQINFGPKKFCSERNLWQKILGQKNLGPKIVFVLKTNFEQKNNILCLKDFAYKKKFGSKKDCWSENILGL